VPSILQITGTSAAHQLYFKISASIYWINITLLLADNRRKSYMPLCQGYIARILPNHVLFVRKIPQNSTFLEIMLNADNDITHTLVVCKTELSVMP